MAGCCLSLQSIISYANITHNSRNLVEAERLLKSNFVITFGATNITEEEVEILALCLQTSAMKDAPHTINGTLRKQGEELNIVDFQCTCKAGKGACKHKTAVLLLCYRNNMRDIPLLSSTDVKCIWNSKKGDVHEMYLPVPISDFCCVKVELNEDVHESINPETVLKRLVEVCPNSALAQNLKVPKRKQCEDEDSSLVNSPKRVQSVDGNYTDLIKNIFLQNVPVKMVPDLPFDQKAFYENHVCVDFDKALEISQEYQYSELWEKQRSLRITASKCYSLYTYTRNKNADWPQKISSYLNKSFQGNSDTQHGLDTEDEAISVFECKNNVKIFKTGLIIHPDIPWLGCSPDGLFILNEQLTSIEIKCPVQGKKSTATEVVKTLMEKQKYISIKNGLYKLKEKHPYYGQIQCGMYVTGIKQCYFVIYSPYDQSYVSLIVDRDENFIADLSSRLHNVYFKYFLPHILMK